MSTYVVKFLPKLAVRGRRGQFGNDDEFFEFEAQRRYSVAGASGAVVVKSIV